MGTNYFATELSQKCKNCGHSGSMHSDGEYTHIGECAFDFEDKEGFCDCKQFTKQGLGEKNE